MQRINTGLFQYIFFYYAFEVSVIVCITNHVCTGTRSKLVPLRSFLHSLIEVSPVSPVWIIIHPLLSSPPSPSTRPIAEENVGRRMLEKMGWKTGEGLGKGGDGMSEPVRLLDVY